MAARSDCLTPTGGTQSLDDRLFFANAGYGKALEAVRVLLEAAV